MNIIKELLRKYLLENNINEAFQMAHFKDRVNEIVDNIESVNIPNSFYLPNIPIDKQNRWIIDQIIKQLHIKIDDVTNKEYPKIKGTCVLVPLGLIKIKSPNNETSKILVSARKNGSYMKGYSYYITIYENRIPTIVLADRRLKSNIETQFQQHLKNTEKNGWAVNQETSFIDAEFNKPIIINLSDLKF